MYDWIGWVEVDLGEKASGSSRQEEQEDVRVRSQPSQWTVLSREGLPGHSDGVEDPERHVAAVGEDETHGAQADSETVGEQEVAARHDGHHPGELVDLLLGHDGPGEALRDAVDGEEENEEALRSEEVGTQTGAEVGSAVEVEEEVGVRVAKQNNNQTYRNGPS